MLFQELHNWTQTLIIRKFSSRADQIREIFSPRIGVTDDNQCSQFDADTPLIMLSRPFDRHIRARDLSYGPRLATLRATIRTKTAAKLLALMMMVVIGLWMCQGNKQPKESLQQFLFSEGGGENRARYPSKNDESQSNRGTEFTLCNRLVADCGWEAAINNLTVDVEWAPDPPPGEARPTT